MGKVSPQRPDTDARGPHPGALGVWLAALQVPRPVNGAIAFASVLLGGWLGVQAVPSVLLIAAASACLIAASGNVLNDLCDVEADRINRPDRPLASGRLPTWVAVCEAAGFGAAGVGAAFTLPPLATALALAAVIALVLYNTRLKGVPLAGNLTVGLLGGLPFLYGGVAVGAPVPSLVPALFAVPFHLGREILKDTEDREGDRVLGGCTLPLRWSHNRVAAVVVAIYGLLVLATPLPVALGIYGYRYLSIVVLLDILLAYVVASFWRIRSPDDCRRLSRLLKLGMLLGIGAIFVDRL